MIGVMPRSLDYTLYDEELWVPDCLHARALAEHDEHYLLVLGRLKPGVTRAEGAGGARRHRAVARASTSPRRIVDRGLAARSAPMEELVRDYRPRLFVLFGAAALRAAHRLRQHRQPAAGPRQRAGARDRHPRGDRRGSRPHPPPGAGREPAARASAAPVSASSPAYWGVAALIALGPGEVPRLGLARVDCPSLGFVLCS